jgi:hypothetical protein
MKGRTVRGFQTLLVCMALAAACASEEGNDFHGPVNGTGATAGKNNDGGAAGASAGFGGTGSGGKGGTANSGGTSSGGNGSAGGIGGKPNGGASGGGAGGTTGGGGSGGSGIAGDCSALNAEGGATSEIEESLHIELRMGNTDIHANNQPGGVFHVVNGTDAAVSLPGLKVRYFFVSEFDCQMTLGYELTVTDYRLQNPHVEAAKGDVQVEVVAVADNGQGCDAYVEIRFSAPESLAAGQYASFDIWSMPPSYDIENDQSNDASYGACSTAVVPWEAVPLYQNDVLIWGDEPYTPGEGGAGGVGGVGSGGDSGGGGAPVGGQSG